MFLLLADFLNGNTTVEGTSALGKASGRARKRPVGRSKAQKPVLEDDGEDLDGDGSDSEGGSDEDWEVTEGRADKYSYGGGIQFGRSKIDAQEGWAEHVRPCRMFWPWLGHIGVMD